MHTIHDKFRGLFGKLRTRASAISVFIAVLLLWQFEATNNIVPQFLLPSPSSVLAEFFGSNVNWPLEIFTTLKEALVGFFVGGLAGLALAVLVVESPFLRRTLLPYLIIFQAIPVIAIAPLVYIFVGFNDISRIILVILLTFFPVVLTTLTGLEDVDKNLVYLMKSLGAREMTILYKVRLPNSTPQLFVGLKLGVLGAVIGAVIAEFVSSSAGLGFLIISAQSMYNVNLAFAAFAILAVLSLALYGSIELAAYLTMPWYRKK